MQVVGGEFSTVGRRARRTCEGRAAGHDVLECSQARGRSELAWSVSRSSLVFIEWRRALVVHAKARVLSAQKNSVFQQSLSMSRQLNQIK